MAVLLKFSTLLLAFIFSCFGAQQGFNFIPSSENEGTTPVLMWESSNALSPKVKQNAALSILDSAEFENIMLGQVAIEKPFILVFVEENLSPEDFVLRESPQFPKVEALVASSVQSRFYPNVQRSLQAIEQLQNKGYKIVTYTPALKFSDLQGPYIVVAHFNDATEDDGRQDLLLRHDSLMNKLYNEALQAHPSVLAIYTGQYSSWSTAESHHRVRRLLQASEVKDATNASIVVDKNNKVMMYFGANPVLNVSSGSGPVELKKPNVATVDERGSIQSFSVIFSEPQKTTVKFKFTLISGSYWKLDEAQVTTSSNTDYYLRTKAITVPLNHSYHCSTEKTVFFNGTTKLILTSFQVQPYLTQAKFGGAHDCVFFFSIPIWCGLFVTTFFGLILTCGFAMIMDIKTMDRFDDPKGKTITINVSE